VRWEAAVDAPAGAHPEVVVRQRRSGCVAAGCGGGLRLERRCRTRGAQRRASGRSASGRAAGGRGLRGSGNVASATAQRASGASSARARALADDAVAAEPAACASGRRAGRASAPREGGPPGSAPATRLGRRSGGRRARSERLRAAGFAVNRLQWRSVRGSRTTAAALPGQLQRASRCAAQAAAGALLCCSSRCKRQGCMAGCSPCAREAPGRPACAPPALRQRPPGAQAPRCPQGALRRRQSAELRVPGRRACAPPAPPPWAAGRRAFAVAPPREA